MMQPRKKKRRVRLATATAVLVAAIGLLATIAGCIGDPASETIIIPENERSGTGVPIGGAFQVSKIYPLPMLDPSEPSVLGWTSGESVVGYFAENGSSAVPATVGLQLLAPPYEMPVPLANLTTGWTKLTSLSPDGKSIAEWTITADNGSLTLVPMDGSPFKSIAIPQAPDRALHSRQIRWSSNSRYLSYVMAGGSRTQLFLVICDTRDGTVRQLPLLNYFNPGGSVSVTLSDDGNAALLDDGLQVAMAKRNGDESFEVQYDHSSGPGGGSIWVDASRFVFLGSDGTLFQYDTRNGELSVLLEKISGFSLSPDRLAIAYTRSDQEAIYAGKLQGNNVLYQTSIYQGVNPDRMTWSLSGDALLIDGSRQPSGPAPEVETAPAAQPGERLQTFILTFQ